MIDNLKISYSCSNVRVELSVDTREENLPYNLAEIITRLIKDSNVNSNIVIDELIDKLGYENE